MKITSATTAVATAALALATTASAHLVRRGNAGQATTYGGNLNGGACSFTIMKSLPSGVYGTALSDSNWSDALYCGACLKVTGPSGNSITAMVVDECPGCGSNHLDLFPDAFTALGSITQGILSVSWEVVACPISTPLQLHNKDGTSQYWFAMQVVNAKEPVQKLEVSTDGGKTWQGTTRSDYNFFENSSGFGTTTVDVKITSTTGSVVTVNNVGVASGSLITASSNFA